MESPNSEYAKILQQVLTNGVSQPPTRGQEFGYKEIFAANMQMIFDLSAGVPVISTKSVWLKGIIHELVWFLNGDNNIRYLIQNSVHIWDKNAYEYYRKIWFKKGLANKIDPIEVWIQDVHEGRIHDFETFEYRWGDLGPVYGLQMRNLRTTNMFGESSNNDQLQYVLDTLRIDPSNRQAIINCWNPSDLADMALPPCHSVPVHFKLQELTVFERNKILGERTGIGVPSQVIGNTQVFDSRYLSTLEDYFKICRTPKYKLHVFMYQRSADLFLGVPFNITSTSLLALHVAAILNAVPGTFVHQIGSAHIYDNHIDQVRHQLERDSSKYPSYFRYKVPKVLKSHFAYTYEDFEVYDYQSDEPIKGKMVV